MLISSFLILTIGLYIFSETNYKIYGIIIISFALNIFANYYKLYNIKESNQMTKWTHKLPLQLYDDLLIIFDFPNQRINKKGGLVIWKKTIKQNIYDEIILKDEEIKKSYSGKIELFCLYLNIIIYIPKNILVKILNNSHNISYNRINYVCTIYTNSIKDGNTILLNILQNVNNNKNINLIKQIEINKEKYNYYINNKIYI